MTTQNAFFAGLLGAALMLGTAAPAFAQSDSMSDEYGGMTREEFIAECKSMASDDAMGGDSMSDDAMGKESGAMDTMGDDAMAKDSMAKDSMSGEGMEKDSMSGDAMGGDAMAGGMSHDDMVARCKEVLGSM